jgi:hypothetical protein
MSGKITMLSEVVYGRSTATPHVRKIERAKI